MNDSLQRGFIRAAALNDTKQLNKLLNKGVDIDYRDSNGYTAIIRAAWLGRAKSIEFLCENGANINAQSNYGESALFCAARNGFEDCVEILLKFKADKTLVTIDDDTALKTARWNKHLKVAELLSA